MLESNYPKKLMKEINKKNKLFDDQLIECAKNNFKKGQEQERKRILEIIDKWETKQPIDQKYKMEKKGIFYNIYNVSELNLQELKQKLTTEGEGK